MGLLLPLLTSMIGCDVTQPAGSAAPKPSPTTAEPSPTRTHRWHHRDSFPWPKTHHFAHNCLEENASAKGDFDGDGAIDVATFFVSGPKNRYGFLPWSVELQLGSGKITRSSADAECPEAIGASDVDGDGRDELFYDTGKGMTAALIDLMRFAHGRLRNLVHRPKLYSSIYVGGSNAGVASAQCFRSPTRIGLMVTDTEGLFGRAAHSAKRYAFVMHDLRLTKMRPERIRIKHLGRGELRCFGLHWFGY